MYHQKQFNNNDFAREYDAALDELTFNSKPIITTLTIVAEENIAHAPDIVSLIEMRIASVRITSL